MDRTKKTHNRKRPLTEKPSEQLTLNALQNSPRRDLPEGESLLPNASSASSPQPNRIAITEIVGVAKEDELVLRIGFKLLPSKVAFSKISSDLWFDEQKLKSVLISIPQSSLATDEFDLTSTLDMTGISAGPHTIKVEMYHLWSSGEMLAYTSKEVTVKYAPQTRASRLIEIPIVKSIEGTDLAVVSDYEKEIHREIEETRKKELISKRDEW